MKYPVRLLVCCCMPALCLLVQPVKAQLKYEVSGVITDTTRRPVDGALISIRALSYGAVARMIKTDSLGRWQVRNFEKVVFNLQIEKPGYETYAGDFYFPASRYSIVLKDILLHNKRNTLKTVEVVAFLPLVVYKEDTLEYNAAAFKVRKDADVEDLLKKLPGLRVNKDGSVTAQGKPVTKIRVNGKDFFDGDIRTATRNLPANIVDKIQVVDDYGEAATFTGFKNSEAEKIINIQLKKEVRRGYFIKLQNGYGTEQRYDLGNAANYFDNNRQASVFVNSNNVNNGGISRTLNSPYFGNLSKLVSTNNNIVESLGGANNVSAMVNNQDFGFLSAIPDYGNGVGNNTSVGVRYSTTENKKISFYGSYIYFHTRQQLNYTAVGKAFFDQAALNQYETLSSSVNAQGQRFFANMEYRPDSSFSIRVMPSLKWQQDNYQAATGNSNLVGNKQINATVANNTGDTRKDQFSLQLLLKKKLRKAGHSLFFESVLENSNNNRDDYNQNIFLTSTLNDSSRQWINGNGHYRAYDNKLLFTAPLFKNMQYQVYYDFRYVASRTGKNTAFYQDTSGKYITDKTYSGEVVSTIYTHTGGAIFKLQHNNTTYTAGAAVQANRFERTGDQLSPYNQAVTNFLPLLQVDYKISGTAALKAQYTGAVNPANPSQLLPVADTSNPLIVFRGNIHLKPEFSNNLHISFYKFSFIDGGVLLLHAGYTQVFNKIIPTVELNNEGKTIVSLINTRYTRYISLYYNISKPFYNKTIEITWGGNISTSRYAFYNNDTHIIHTFRHNQGLEISYNKDWGEFTAGAGINTQHFLFKQKVTPVVDLSYYQRSTFYLSGFKFGWELSLIRPGSYLLPEPNKTIWLLNAFAEKKLTKRLTIKLTGNDLLDRSTLNYNRIMRDNYVTDYRYNVTGRYLLLFVVFKINRFH